MGDAATDRAAIDSVAADGIVPRLLARLDEQAEADELRPAREPVTGVLNWNTTVDVPVTLVAESEYVIQGVCDADCRNLDLSLMDPAGRAIWTKEYADTSPEIRGTAAQSGTYVVRVLMRACASPRCGFGVAFYTSAPDEEG